MSALAQQQFFHSSIAGTCVYERRTERRSLHNLASVAVSQSDRNRLRKVIEENRERREREWQKHANTHVHVLRNNDYSAMAESFECVIAMAFMWKHAIGRSLPGDAFKQYVSPFLSLSLSLHFSRSLSEQHTHFQRVGLRRMRPRPWKENIFASFAAKDSCSYNGEKYVVSCCMHIHRSKACDDSLRQEKLDRCFSAWLCIMRDYGIGPFPRIMWTALCLCHTVFVSAHFLCICVKVSRPSSVIHVFILAVENTVQWLYDL